MKSTALQELKPQQMLERVNQARFPKDLTAAERQLMARVSIDYGLDPLFCELMIYQGQPYVTINARRRKAQETETLDGINSRPATKEEREARGVPEGDYLFMAQVWVKGASHPFEGWGRVRAAETKGDPHLPIVKDPAAQAEKRSEAQGLRRAFHLDLPSVEDIIEGEFTQVTAKKPPPGDNHLGPKPEPSPTNAAATNRATPAQLNKIRNDGALTGYKPDEITKIAQVTFQVTSLENLSVPQASKLIDMIKSGEGLQVESQEKGGD